MRRVAAAVLGSLALHALAFFVASPTFQAPAPGMPPGKDALRVWLLPGRTGPRSPVTGYPGAPSPSPGAPPPEAGPIGAPPAAEALSGGDQATGSKDRSDSRRPGSGAETPVMAGGAHDGSANRVAGEYSNGAGELLPAEPLDAIAPRYPEAARRRGKEGAVRLLLEVDASGRIVSVSVEESSGVSLLDRAATQAAETASFRPARRRGAPVPSSVRVTVLFELDSDTEG